MTDKQRILVADDDPVIHLILRDMLESNGYEVVTAMSGEAALNELIKNRYDLLVSDVMMEGMGGIELVKTVKQIKGYQNLPVILLSGKKDSETKISAFDALADDYVTKPFDIDELAARIKTQLRLRHLQEEIENNSRLLNQRNEELEANLDIAKRFQRKLLPLDTTELNGLNISSFFQPIDKVGGDLFDIIPLGDGLTGVFISDVSGHGVPAAFLNITLKMTLRAIVAEEIKKTTTDIYTFRVLEKINKQIMRYVNDGDFITALYSIIDVNNKMLYISSAGHPKAIIMRKEGSRVSYIESRGLCLGFSSDASYTTNALKIYPGDCIIYYTDGLLEMKGTNGRKLGSNGLIDIIKRCSDEVNPGRLTANIVRELQQFSHKREYDDDITILCLETTDSYNCNWTTSSIDIDRVTELLISPLQDKCRDDSIFIKKIKVAVYEALMNAIDHGNLEISSRCKNVNSDEVLYESIKNDRLTDPEYGNRKVLTGYQVSNNRITYHIKDEGCGFNIRNIADPTAPHNLGQYNGRGLALIKMYMDEVSFNDKGNEIIMVKDFGSSLRKS